MSNVSAVKNTKRTVDLGDGVEREVILSLNAMADLEEKYGSIEAAFAKVQEGSVAAIRYLLWCILVPDGDEDLTVSLFASTISVRLWAILWTSLKSRCLMVL